MTKPPSEMTGAELCKPKATHVYIGRLECGCVVSVVVDYGNKMTGDHVAESIAEGEMVERVEMEAFRKIRMGCVCAARALLAAETGGQR
jgi:hypothetical protein